MWFNGTALSAQARRALENERVTVVAHETGCIHILYPEATIDPEAYDHFSGKLRKFLQSPLTPEILGNFVRHSPDLQKCFQVRWRNFGVDHYIDMEKLLAYERDFPYRFNDDTRERLSWRWPARTSSAARLPNRIVLDDLEQMVKQQRVDIRTAKGFALLVDTLGQSCPNAQNAIERLRSFIWTEPRLPDPATKTFVRDQTPLALEIGMEREDVIARLESIRGQQRAGRPGLLRLPRPEPGRGRAVPEGGAGALPGVDRRHCEAERRRAHRQSGGHARRVHLRRAGTPGPARRGLELRPRRRR